MVRCCVWVQKRVACGRACVGSRCVWAGAARVRGPACCWRGRAACSSRQGLCGPLRTAAHGRGLQAQRAASLLRSRRERLAGFARFAGAAAIQTHTEAAGPGWPRHARTKVGVRVEVVVCRGFVRLRRREARRARAAAAAVSAAAGGGKSGAGLVHDLAGMQAVDRLIRAVVAVPRLHTPALEPCKSCRAPHLCARRSAGLGGLAVGIHVHG